MHEAISSRGLRPGVLMALASAALFGACTPVAKLMLGSVEPQLLAGLLYLGAGGGLALVRATRAVAGRKAMEVPLRRSDVPWLGLIILFGGVLAPLLLMLGLTRTSAASASLLMNLEGVATIAIAGLVFHENVDGKLIVGGVAILAGATILSWQGAGVRFDSGGLMIATACLAWGIDNNLTRKLSAADPVVIALTKGLAAGGVNVTLAIVLGAHTPDHGLTAAALVVGFFGVGMSLVLFVLALRELGSARTAAYFSLASFIGAAVSVALVGEPVTSQLVAAGVLMAFGLWLHLAEQHVHEHAHEANAHEHSHRHDAHHNHSHDGAIHEPHAHWHRHEPQRHSHAHYPDVHHRHDHG